MAWIPQRGTNNGVDLPATLPQHDFLLKGLEPLGWIKTQSQELNHLSAADVTTQAKIMAVHPQWGPNSICITCAFTPGSVSLNAWELTVAGFEWGRKNTDVTGAHAGYNASMANRVQLLLSDRILGMTLVPEGGVWNYGVGLTQSWSDKIAYNMTLDKPESFWAACHRPVSYDYLVLMNTTDVCRTLSSTLPRWRVMMPRMSKTVLRRRNEMDEMSGRRKYRESSICLYKRAITALVAICIPFRIFNQRALSYTTHPDQAPDHHTPQIMATNALTPIPALISPNSNRTRIVHGQPISLSRIVPIAR